MSTATTLTCEEQRSDSAARHGLRHFLASIAKQLQLTQGPYNSEVFSKERADTSFQKQQTNRVGCIEEISHVSKDLLDHREGKSGV